MEQADDILVSMAPPGKPGGPSSGSPASREKSRFRRYFLPLLVLFMVLFSLVQFAGTVLRDRLEGRTITSSQDLVLRAVERSAPPHHEATEGAGRGFGVTEIPVGAVPSEATQTSTVHSGAGIETVKESAHTDAHQPEKAAEKAREPEKKTEPKGKETASAAKPAGQVKEAKNTAPAAKAEAKTIPAKESVPKVAAQPKEAVAKAETKPETKPKPQPQPKSEAKAEAKVETKAEVRQPQPASPSKEETPKPVVKAAAGARFSPDPSGGYAVAVGAFNSQRLAGLVEKRLDELGFPHTRSITMKDADGYTLTVGAASEAVTASAAKALTDGGYKADKAEGKLALRFISQEEAEKAKAVAEKAGAEGSIKKAVGQVPLWRVLVGPTNAENARKASEALKTEGMDSVVVRYKP